MFFTSDNASGGAPEIMAAVQTANAGFAASYGADNLMHQVQSQIRHIFNAPDAAVYLVATGTAANALALALYCPPWTSVFAHTDAHIAVDECGAPEFFTNGAKMIGVGGAHGKMTPESLTQAIGRIGQSGVHGVQRGMVSITNVTEAGTVYTPGEVAALTAVAKAHGLPSHMDGARFTNALVATNASAADMTWAAGIDILSFGGTKNGCLGVEAVVIFDPAKAWEFELRRKRGGHLFSKHRFLSAQMLAYLADDLWQRLARHANAMGAALASGLAAKPGVRMIHPVGANMLFPEWPNGTHAALQSQGAAYYPMALSPTMESARLVTSWSTAPEDVARFLDAMPP